MQPSADPFLSVGRQHQRAALDSRVAVGLGVVEESMHVSTQCAREPGDLQSVCASRPVREGERPICTLHSSQYDVCPKHKVSWIGASNLGSPVQSILQIAAIVLAGLLRPRLGSWISVPYMVHSLIVKHEPSDPALGLEKNRGNLFSDWGWRRARTRVVEVPQPNRESETNRRRHQNGGIWLADWNAGL
jgi:hypothetical protein